MLNRLIKNSKLSLNDFQILKVNILIVDDKFFFKKKLQTTY